ncbi:MAG: hypothetical protein JJE52_14325 [Acidimicrobiia bacterium]|nr:hypothetical protein [Acidimicrobiia bacterium]
MDDVLDREIRAAMGDIARSAPQPTPFDPAVSLVVPLAPPTPRRSVPPLVGAAAASLVVVAAAAGVWLAAGDDEVVMPATGGPSDATGADTVESDLVESDLVESDPFELPAIEPFDGDVAAAVAPFDHDSNVDSQLLELWVAAYRDRAGDECLVAQGRADLVVERPLPLDRDDPLLVANAAFPDPELLAAEGLVVPPGTPFDPTEPTPGDDALVVQGCNEQVVSSGADVVHIGQLFAVLRAGWARELELIDTTSEVEAAAAALGSCLRDQGIPAEYTSEPRRFFGYVDSLRRALADDVDRQDAVIRLEHGRLYAECGASSGYFTVREQMRSGDRRTAFLAEHAPEIDELTALVTS